MTRKMTALAIVFGAVCAAACSSSSDMGKGATIDNTPMGLGGTDSGTSGGGSGNVLLQGSGGHTGPILGIPDACASRDLAAEQLPVDMYIMFDQSSSMASAVPGANPPTTWWAQAQVGVAGFVQDPRANGIGVGIQFFPFHGLTDPNKDPTSPSSSCYIPNYVTPEVEIGLLPGNSAAIVSSIQAHAPTTFTPTAAALQGAIQHMQAWGPQHPGRQPVVVLVTDGFPTECDPQDPSLIAQIAKAAYEGTPRVLTFVVGFQDAEALDNLSQIAKAGGTVNAFLIKGGDIGAQFVDAMLGISATPLSCTFDIPPSPDAKTESIDLNNVSVVYTPSANHVPLAITRLTNAGECDSASDGWYYDAPPPQSKQINMCPQTCQKFAAGVMHIEYGCQPAVQTMH